MELYDKTSFKCSQVITRNYSTSFSLGINCLAKKYRDPIYAIYGFVRYADEIVDTFHDFDKPLLLENFIKDTYTAIENKISLNPVLHSFQLIVNKYEINHELIDAFLESMKTDLYRQVYEEKDLLKKYIYGSAEVVGLMCLKVFCGADNDLFDKLKEPAQRLGAAFQKVNFLRDIKSDYAELGRIYFPGIEWHTFDNRAKTEIEKEIKKDFSAAYKGILQLPKGARLGVYLAYVYYLQLFKKISSLPANDIMNRRVRVSDNQKLLIFVQTYLKSRFNVL
jgi:15-cis-phytoene synthase